MQLGTAQLIDPSRGKNEKSLTSKPNAMLNDPQILGLAQLRRQRTAARLDDLGKRRLDLAVPVVLLSAATQDDAAVLATGEDVRGFTVAVGGAEVHFPERLFWGLDE